MRFLVLATDYDETLADHGRVRPEVLAALERVKASGRKLVLVSGRELPDLRRVFPGVTIFDAVVAENGALLYLAETREERPLGERPSEELVRRLAARGVSPLFVGRGIVATREPHHHAVLEEIRDLGLELQVIFNKGAVMVLPSGVHKGSGLAAALAALCMSTHNCVAVGDAENDHALLAEAECGVAVANALPALRTRADWVLARAAGDGVIELVDRLLADDLADVPLERRMIVLGADADGQPVAVPPAGPRLLFAGTPGSGKSTAAKATIERLIAAGYQCLILDPEGDFERFSDALVLGDAERPPSIDEIGSALRDPTRSVVANLVGVPLADRPPFFTDLLPRIVDLRATTGRPHWLILDEAHHLVPASWKPAELTLPAELGSLLVITVVPHEVTPAILARLDTAVIVGKRPFETLADFARVTGRPVPPPDVDPGPLTDGEALFAGPDRSLRRLTVAPTRNRHQRHLRKYAQGELTRDRSFYFKGPRGELNLRAQNLTLFCQLAEGVDDDTWRFHLRNGDYAEWFRRTIKDDEIARVADECAADAEMDAAESRRRVLGAILSRYTLPAGTLEPAQP
jgi:hydroxymethylpyrimidine pyrophosphatase-like HAD family hydrolase